MKDIKLRGDNNIMLTQALFVEHGNREAPYTMKHESYGPYMSAYEVYMSSVDEYEAAIKLVKNRVHWKKLCELDWFMNGFPEKNISGLKEWRKDMALRDASTAKKVLLEQASEGNVTAAKTLLESSNKSNKAGRPKKTEPSKPTGALAVMAEIRKRGSDG